MELYEVWYGRGYSKFFNSLNEAIEFYNLKGTAIYRIKNPDKKATKNNRERIIL